jgi:membrane protein
MRFEGGETTAVLRTVTERVREQNLTFLAGSLAYNAFISLIPLLLLLLFAVGTVGSEMVATRVSGLTEAYLTAGAQTEIRAAVDNADGEVGLSVTSLLVLLWGALKLFRGLDTAFAEVYATEYESSLFKQFRDGFVAFAALGLSLVTIALAGAAFAYLQVPLLHVLNPLFLLAGLSLAFLPMYYVFPDVEMTVREALPGAVVAAGGWAILEVGFQVYAANAGQYEAYGVIGGVLLLLTWLYFGGFVLLVGAAVNAVIREREHARRDATAGGAEPLERTGGPSTDAHSSAEAGAATTEAAPSGTAATASTTPTDGPRSNDDAVAADRRERGVSDGDDGGRRARRRLRNRSTRNVVAAFAVGVAVGLAAVAAAAVRFAR